MEPCSPRQCCSHFLAKCLYKKWKISKLKYCVYVHVHTCMHRRYDGKPQAFSDSLPWTLLRASDLIIRLFFIHATSVFDSNTRDVITCTPPNCLQNNCHQTWKRKITVITLPAHHHTVFKTTATHMETQICSGLTTCTPPHCLHYNCHSHGNTKLQWSYYLHTITLSLKQLSLTCNHKFAVILLPAHCTPPHCLQNNCYSHGNTKMQWSCDLHPPWLERAPPWLDVAAKRSLHVEVSDAPARALEELISEGGFSCVCMWGKEVGRRFGRSCCEFTRHVQLCVFVCVCLCMHTCMHALHTYHTIDLDLHASKFKAWPLWVSGWGAEEVVSW